jgi:hypothetical protein
MGKPFLLGLEKDLQFHLPLEMELKVKFLFVFKILDNIKKII